MHTHLDPRAQLLQAHDHLRHPRLLDTRARARVPLRRPLRRVHVRVDKARARRLGERDPHPRPAPPHRLRLRLFRLEISDQVRRHVPRRPRLASRPRPRSRSRSHRRRAPGAREPVRGRRRPVRGVVPLRRARAVDVRRRAARAVHAHHQTRDVRVLRRRLLPLPLRAGRRGPRDRRAQRALVHGAALGRGRVRVSLVLAVPEPLVVLARRPRGLARAVDRERLHGDAVRGGLDAARVGRRDRAAGVVGVLARGRHGSGSVCGGLRGRLLLLLRRHLLWLLLLLLLLLLHLLRGGLGPNRGFTARRARPVPVRGLLLARVGILDVLCYQAPVSPIRRAADMGTRLAHWCRGRG